MSRSLLLLLAACASSTTPDQRPPPGSLPLLTLSPFAVGSQLQIRADGVEPGETVFLMLGNAAADDAGPCPPQMGGLCVDLTGNPRLFLQADANATGSLETSIGPIPDLPGLSACFQAIALRGVDTIKGNVVCGTIGYDADGDGVFDPDDVCSGGDDTRDVDGDGVPDDCDELDVSDDGLFLHLDATVGLTVQGDLVSSWEDQSGAGNHVSQTDPLLMPTLEAAGLEGHPTLRFDEDSLTRADGFGAGDYTKVITYAIDAHGVSNNLLSSTNGGHAVYYASSTGVRMWHNGTFVFANRPTELDQLTTVVATYDADTQTGRLYQDGILVGEGTNAPHVNESMQVGSHADANFLVGRISEIRAYDRVLSTDEVGAMQAYVDDRYLGGLSSAVRLLGPTSWYSASTGLLTNGTTAISGWADQSGNGLDLAQTDPARQPRVAANGIGGRTSVRFTDDRLSRSDGFPLGDYTKVAVFQPEAFGPGLENNIFSSEGTGHALYYGQSDLLRMWHGGRSLTSDTASRPGEALLAVSTWDASTQEAVLYQDGVAVARRDIRPHGSEVISIGSHGMGNWFRGEISELIAFDTVLSEGERESVTASLQRRYGLFRFTDRSDVEEMPAPMQVLQRDATDTCAPRFTGTLTGGASDGVRVEILADGSSQGFAMDSVVRIGGEARYDITAPIAADLVDYELILSARQDGVWTELARVDQVACGDLLMLSGQSNAEARLFYGENAELLAYESHWARTWGSAASSAGALSDTVWDTATAQQTRGHATVGQWGLMLMAEIIDVEGVPVGLINGAVGGTTIAANSRDDANPNNLNTIYGRQLTRAQMSGIADNARAIFWYQGESDGGNTEAYYANAFAELRADWVEDYAALEKIYVVQVRSGCGGPTTVREAMRTLPATHPDVEVMSTTGLSGHDGCHYLHVGYRELTDRLFPLMQRDLYGGPDDDAIRAPNIIDATFTTPTELTLTFEPASLDLTWDDGSQSYFQVSDGTTVTSGSASGNTVTLQLSAPSTASTVNYIGHTGDGPWVLNSRGIGLLTFFDFPID